MCNKVNVFCLLLRLSVSSSAEQLGKKILTIWQTRLEAAWQTIYAAGSIILWANTFFIQGYVAKRRKIKSEQIETLRKTLP